MPLTAHDVLGPDGLIAKRLPNYEHRQQQLDMARAVAQAIANNQHLICEAGTGVGKSFGYLVPAILAATSENKDKKIQRVIVSTHTIALQEQLLSSLSDPDGKPSLSSSLLTPTSKIFRSPLLFQSLSEEPM